MNKYPAIPDPQMSLESLHTTVVALKQVIELMAGVRGGAKNAQVFIQDTQPVTGELGDLWIVPSATYRVMAWIGTQWVPVKAP